MSTPSQPPEKGPQSPSLHQQLKNFTMAQPQSFRKPDASNPSTATASTTPSSRTSFSGSAPTGITSLSNPPTPDAFQGTMLADVSSLAPLELPRSPSTLSTIPSAPTSASLTDQGRTGRSSLMRRLSNRTGNKLRARTSSSNLRNREENTGPTVVRTRSGSRTMHDHAIDISDFELDSVDEQSLGDLSLDDRNPRQRRLSSRPTPPRLASRSCDDDGRPILPPEVLRDGKFQKVTKRKTKVINMRLDDKLTKLSWCFEGQSSRKHVLLNDLVEVRTGKLAHTHVAEFGKPESVTNQWLSIMYSDPTQTRARSSKALHLIAPNLQTCLQWKESLEALLQDRRDMMAGAAGNIEDERYLHRLWSHTLSTKFGDNVPTSELDQVLSRDDMRKSCRRCCIYMNEAEFNAQFDKVCLLGHNVLTRGEFLEFYRSIRERRDLREIFEHNKDPSSETMSKEKFFHLLRRRQGVDVSENTADYDALFNRYADDDNKGLGISMSDDEDGSMSFKAFRAFFLDDNALVPEVKTKPLLDQPLTDYFISSSHNTYLTGWQWGGHSSAEPYVDALKQGCRCVEIDCWNGDDGKPWVTHGNTGTTGVSFVSCIKAINLWAFRMSPYPLIISLEVHCNPAQQKEMVTIMKECFGTKLVTEPIDSRTCILPSPEELRNRILIKVKEPMALPPSSYNANLTVQTNVGHRRSRSKSEADATSSPIQSPSTPMEIRTDLLGLDGPHPQRSATVNSTRSRAARYPPAQPFNPLAQITSSDDSDAEGPISPSKKKKIPPSKIVRELGVLGVYTQGIKFQDFNSPGSRLTNHVYSFSESTFKEKSKTPQMKAALEKHNRHHLMRVYPKGTRANSSNFDPLLYWRHGVQMAATNWQTYDMGTEINDAMFASGHDRTGYVLKPKEIRTDSSSITSPPGSAKKKLSQFSVRIISARHLQPPADSKDSTINPCIRVEILSADDPARGLAEAVGGTEASSRGGVSGLGAPTTRQTKIVEDNGWNPIFNESIDLALQTDYPGLVFVRFTAWHSHDGRTFPSGSRPLCAHTAKLSSLQQGYRLLHLRDRHGDSTVSKLLVRIEKQDDQDNLPLSQAPTLTTSTRDHSPESPRVSEEAPRPSRRLFGLFSRTPSERRKAPKKETDPGYFSRTVSVERNSSVQH